MFLRIFHIFLFSLLFPTNTVFATKLIGTYGNWEAYTEQESERLVCYIGSEPIKKRGKYKKRGQTYILITHRPNEKSLNVVSIAAGYIFKKNSTAWIIIGKKKTELFTDAQHAFAYDAKADKDLVNLMIKGATMVVKGSSSRSTKTTDTYSLKGFTAAYKAINLACKI